MIQLCRNNRVCGSAVILTLLFISFSVRPLLSETQTNLPLEVFGQNTYLSFIWDKASGAVQYAPTEGLDATGKPISQELLIPRNVVGRDNCGNKVCDVCRRSGLPDILF